MKSGTLLWLSRQYAWRINIEKIFTGCGISNLKMAHSDSFSSTTSEFTIKWKHFLLNSARFNSRQYIFVVFLKSIISIQIFRFNFQLCVCWTFFFIILMKNNFLFHSKTKIDPIWRCCALFYSLNVQRYTEMRYLNFMVQNLILSFRHFIHAKGMIVTCA